MHFLPGHHNHLCVCVVGCSSEQNGTQAVSSANSPPAPLAGLQVTHQMPAVIAEDEPDLKLSVPVTNATPNPVRFEKIGHSCACSSAKLQKMELAPNEKTHLEVKINLRGRKGEQRLAVTLVETSGRNWQQLIEFTIYPRARFNTGNETLQLTEAKPKTPLAREVVLEFFDIDPKQLPSVPSFTTDGQPFQLQADAPKDEQVAPNIWTRRVPLHLSYVAPDRAGPYYGEVIASFPQRGENRKLKLHVNGYVQSLFKVTPEFVFFEATTTFEDTCSRKVTIRRNDGQPLAITKFETSNSKVKALVEPTSNPSIIALKLTLSDKEMKDHLYGEAILHTNQPQQPTLKVQFAAAPRKNG